MEVSTSASLHYGLLCTAGFYSHMRTYMMTNAETIQRNFGVCMFTDCVQFQQHHKAQTLTW